MPKEMENNKMYASITYQVDAPEGRVFVNVCEDDEGRPMMVQLNIGKAGASIGAWAFATAALCTRLLETGSGINDLIEMLSEHTSDKRTTLDITMVPVRSGPDALCVALMRYRVDKFREHQEILDGRAREEEYRAPTFRALAG